MASDSMGSYADVSETIAAMTAKKVDILIGTQMIAKGHHFSDLAVVGVVDADLGLAMKKYVPWVYFLASFLPAIGRALPLRVRALVWVRWP